MLKCLENKFISLIFRYAITDKGWFFSETKRVDSNTPITEVVE